MTFDDTWDSPAHFEAEQRADDLSEKLTNTKKDVLRLAELVMSKRTPGPQDELFAYQAAERARKYH